MPLSNYLRKPAENENETSKHAPLDGLAPSPFEVRPARRPDASTTRSDSGSGGRDSPSALPAEDRDESPLNEGNSDAATHHPFPPTVRPSQILRPAITLLFRKHRLSGVFRVRIHTQRGAQWISTGQTSIKNAKEVCDQAMVERLQMTACADALTPDVISRLTTGRRFTCADILEAWKEDAIIDLAPDTFNAYETVLKQWMESCDCTRRPLSAIKRTVLNGFVNEEGIAVGTRRNRLAALRSYYKFANSAGFCVGNMAERVRVQVRDILFMLLETKKTEPITEEEYSALIASDRVSQFWKCAIVFGWWLGLRLRDIACMEWASIGVTTITIWTQKSGARVELSLTEPLIGGAKLHEIIAEMRSRRPEDAKFCFPGERERALDPKRRASLSVAFQRVLLRHGIKGKRFHSLRHACATRMERAGKTLEDIGLILGHASTETTEIYTDHE